MAKFLLILATLAVCSLAQRPYYVRHPVGYPEIVSTSEPPSVIPQQQSNAVDLGTRFGDAIEEPTETVFIPIEFQSDPLSYYYYLGLPTDNRPFNVINAPQIQEFNSKPHTYSFRPNHYAAIQANMGDIH